MLIGIICALFLLRLLLRLSLVSVVFDFNVSHNDVTPISSMPFPVDLMRMEKNRFVYGCHLCVVSFVTTF